MIFLLKSNFPASQDPETRLTPRLSFPAVLHAHQHPLGLLGLAQSHDEDVTVDHLIEGKRCILLKDYASAVESLALACEALSMQFGDTAS